MDPGRRTRLPDPKCPYCRGFGIFFVGEFEGSMTAVARRCPCTMSKDEVDALHSSKDAT